MDIVKSLPHSLGPIRLKSQEIVKMTNEKHRNTSKFLSILKKQLFVVLLGFFFLKEKFPNSFNFL